MTWRYTTMWRYTTDYGWFTLGWTPQAFEPVGTGCVYGGGLRCPGPWPPPCPAQRRCRHGSRAVGNDNLPCLGLEESA